jgi:hypothetical protein
MVVFASFFLPSSLTLAQRSKEMDADRAVVIKGGAPLNHTVKIQRTGSVLKFDYALIGTDGKTYDLWEINDQSKPVFSVYRGDEKVGGGEFEFG